jgi:hypothetical protein
MTVFMRVMPLIRWGGTAIPPPSLVVQNGISSFKGLAGAGGAVLMRMSGAEAGPGGGTVRAPMSVFRSVHPTMSKAWGIRRI